jgi:membrane protease subunit HflC
VLITREDEQKVVVYVTGHIGVRRDPGIWLRAPLVSDVLTFDKRRLYLNTEPLPIQTRDEERVVVDNYVVWRITDPLLYRQSFPTGRAQAEAQIDAIVRSEVRNTVGQRTLAEVVTTSRVEIMAQITQRSDAKLQNAGVTVDDVRVNRTELPPGTETNVFARMRTERERLARKARAEGEEEGRRIRAEADRDARVIVAEARRDAEMTRGNGDAEAARIYGEAFAGEAEFYDFVRTLQAYRKTIGEKTTLVLSPSSEFFRLMARGTGARGESPAREP